MNIEKDLLYHTETYHDKLKKICDPMYRFFGVEDMVIHFVKGVSLINIHTNRTWMEYCMEKKYFNDDTHIVRCQNIRTGFTICSCHPCEKYINGLLKDGIEYGMYHSVDYARKTRNGYQAFSFSTNADNFQMPDKMLNNKEYVIKFANYLIEELQPNLRKLSERAIDIEQLKGKYLDWPENICNLEDSKEKIAFLKQIKAIDSDFTDATLSPREVSCLQHYLNGKTAADTGKILFLSRRTVEGYLENVKIKLGCKYKKDLFDKIELLRCLGYLSEAYPQEN